MQNDIVPERENCLEPDIVEMLNVISCVQNEYDTNDDDDDVDYDDYDDDISSYYSFGTSVTESDTSSESKSDCESEKVIVNDDVKTNVPGTIQEKRDRAATPRDNGSSVPVHSAYRDIGSINMLNKVACKQRSKQYTPEQVEHIQFVRKFFEMLREKRARHEKEAKSHYLHAVVRDRQKNDVTHTPARESFAARTPAHTPVHTPVSQTPVDHTQSGAPVKEAPIQATQDDPPDESTPISHKLARSPDGQAPATHTPAHTLVAHTPVWHSPARPAENKQTGQTPVEDSMNRDRTNGMTDMAMSEKSLQRIQCINEEIDTLGDNVKEYSGMRGEKEYLLIEELLTRSLLKLDEIDSEGVLRVQTARKAAVKRVQALVKELESTECSENRTDVSQKKIDTIQEIRQEAEVLEARVKEFRGQRGEKECLQLEEMMTRLLLRLDAIESGGLLCIQQPRRDAVRLVQAIMKQLESKFSADRQVRRHPQRADLAQDFPNGGNTPVRYP